MGQILFELDRGLVICGPLSIGFTEGFGVSGVRFGKGLAIRSPDDLRALVELMSAEPSDGGEERGEPGKARNQLRPSAKKP